MAASARGRDGGSPKPVQRRRVLKVLLTNLSYSTKYMYVCVGVWGVQWKWHEDQWSLADG